MQCPACGYQMSDFDTECLRCKKAAGSSPAQAFPQASPPPQGTIPAAYGYTPAADPWPGPGIGSSDPENTSGQHHGVPPQVAAYRWNWGAFLWSWIWCFNHDRPLLGSVQLTLALVNFAIRMMRLPEVNIPQSPVLLVLSPLCSLGFLGIMIYLGLYGHRIAWENRRFPDGYPQYLAVEREWSKWGYAIVFPVYGLGVLGVVLAAVLYAVNLNHKVPETQALTGGAAYSAPAAQAGPASIGATQPQRERVIIVHTNGPIGPYPGGRRPIWVPGGGRIMPGYNGPYQGLPPGFDNYGRRIEPGAAAPQDGSNNAAPAGSAVDTQNQPSPTANNSPPGSGYNAPPTDSNSIPGDQGPPTTTPSQPSSNPTSESTATPSGSSGAPGQQVGQ